MLNFALWRPFCFLMAILFFKKISNFFWSVHTNFHTKSGLCSSRNERLMHNFVFWRPFCFSKFRPYELPYKIWSLQLKKWLSYCTRYERGHFLLLLIVYIQHHLLLRNILGVQMSFFPCQVFLSGGQTIKKTDFPPKR